MCHCKGSGRTCYYKGNAFVYTDKQNGKKI